ncbi:MAG: hypothetical protein HY929_08750 [Euryarchaeota archaeon]|nr:hypothetical protein [Euryarchaeota archaeon]
MAKQESNLEYLLVGISVGIFAASLTLTFLQRLFAVYGYWIQNLTIIAALIITSYYILIRLISGKFETKSA